MSNNQSNPNGSAIVPMPDESDDQPANINENEPDAGNQTIDQLANIAFPSSSVTTDDQPSNDDVASGNDGIAVPLSSTSIDDVPRVNDQAGTNADVIMTGGETANPSSSCPQQLDYDTGQCAICLSPQADRSRPRCGHVFCFDCLKEWCRVKLECPTCRQPFTNFVHKITGTAPNEISEVYTPDPPVIPPAIRRITIRLPAEWLPLLNDPQFQQFLLLIFLPIIGGGQAENPVEPPPNPPSDDQQSNTNNASNNSN
ncbi:hypothetical protein GHT06_012169 [Daphnia sinensis]|uniref:RING-type E3 ubiquitin transferase n=1 Tax=Daphnia sinensis TaxID=1820382 RepID=A0AAD5LNR5_9CRUS|nr:hypothetical protein GHT06_012169 [Daphnia sinensis]